MKHILKNLWAKKLVINIWCDYMQYTNRAALMSEEDLTSSIIIFDSFLFLTTLLALQYLSRDQHHCPNIYGIFKINSEKCTVVSSM